VQKAAEGVGRLSRRKAAIVCSGVGSRALSVV